MNYKINTYQKKDSNFAQLSFFIRLSLLFFTRISLRSLWKPRFPLKVDNSLDTALQTHSLQVCITNPTLGILSKIDKYIWVW